MPASPVCLDTLVLATVGAAKNLLKLEAIKNLFLVTGTTGHVGMKVLAIPVSSDIQHPLLLSVKSNNILMRELFPQSKQKASPFVNRLKKMRNGTVTQKVMPIWRHQLLIGKTCPASRRYT